MCIYTHIFTYMCIYAYREREGECTFINIKMKYGSKNIENDMH